MKDFNGFIDFTTENVSKIAYDASVPLKYGCFHPVMDIISDDVAKISYSLTISLLRQYHEWLLKGEK
jgi:fibrillarin-like rRNA methylase